LCCFSGTRSAAFSVQRVHNRTNRHPTASDYAAPAPTATQAVPTNTPSQPQQTETGQGVTATLDVNGVAQDFTSEVIEAVLPGPDRPWWEPMPQYTLLTLSGYLITDHLMKPQIYIYPAKDLGVNEAAGKAVAELQELLQDQQAGEELPFLPLFNAAQMMHAQVKYLDPQNGKGVRYLTQYTQGIVPINNHELIYTYQGLTSDGKYYVAAVLPVNLASLPTDEKWHVQEPPVGEDFGKYIDEVVSNLNEQPTSAFTPDLSKLDALIQSIEIND